MQFFIILCTKSFLQVIQVYQIYSYWFDIYDFGKYFLYGLIYCGKI